jgi:hypothetical protein
MSMEVKEGVKERRVIQYAQWKKINAREMRRGVAGQGERMNGVGGSACAFDECESICRVNIWAHGLHG